MKKPVAILLLFFVCLLSCMLPVRYGLKQAAKLVMHQRMQQGREDAYVLIAAAGLTAAQWEDEREFRLNGHMYDVAGIEYNDGVKFYRCIADQRETGIEQRSDELIVTLSGQDRNQQQSGIAQFLSDWLQGLYLHTSPMMSPVRLSPLLVAGFLPAGEAEAEDPLLYQRIIPPEDRKA